MFLPHLYISKKVTAFQRNIKIPFEEYRDLKLLLLNVSLYFILFLFLRHISFSG